MNTIASSCPHCGEDGIVVECASWPIRIVTPRLVLRTPTREDACAAAAYFERNADHFAPWMPPAPEGLYEIEWWEEEIESQRRDCEAGRSIRLFVYARGDELGPIVAHRAFTRIHLGQDRACTMSGGVDHGATRRGIATEAGRAGIHFAFHHLGLHRIDSEYRADNPGSGGVLGGLGFTRIGVAPRYRYIGGDWRDYVLMCLLNDEAPEPEVGRYSHRAA